MTMLRILDLGCGTGDSWRKLGLPTENWQVVGVDVVSERFQAANQKYSDRGWRYVRASGENIPLAEGSVDGVLCWLSLPYMHIPRALAELHRVLVPGGWLRATLHGPGFTWSELRQSFPRPKQSLFRVLVFLNGVVLHFSGGVIQLGGVSESCQTEAGMRIALRRAGFTAAAFRHEGGRFFVEAQRDGTVSSLKSVA